MPSTAWSLSTASTLAALAAAGVGVDLLARREGRVVRLWGNEVLAQLLATDAESLVGDAGDGGLPASVRQHVEGLFDTPRSPTPPPLDVIVTTTSSAPLPIRIAFRRGDLEGEPVVVRCFSRLQRPQAVERALARSDRRLLELLETAPDVVFLLRDEHVVYANQSTLYSIGLRELEDLENWPLARFVHAEDLPRLRAQLAAASEGVPPAAPIEVRLQRVGGELVALELVSIPTAWEGRSAVLAIGHERQRRREAWLESVHADRLSAVGTLAAGVAHEINNPLAYVLLNLQYILRELPKLTTQPERLTQLQGRLAEARHGAERVRSIIRDLRDFSLPVQTELGPVDLVRVCEAALKVAGPHCEGHATVLREYAVVPRARADAGRLEQVLSNLVTNALHAMPIGRPEQNRLWVRVGTAGEGRVGVEVSDNGAGIPAELLDRVFDPFFTTKPVGVGTGLGLPICYSIVTALGGTIGVESQPGRGTTFRVELPIESGPIVEDAVTPPPPAEVSAQRARVLIIDDELQVADILRRMLADEFDVEVATEAPQAMKMVLDGPAYDVLLCDLLMPGMDGVELFAELRERRPGTERRIIFMTGGAFTPRAADFLATVPNERLEKPLDLGALRRTVRRTAERSR